MRQFFEKSTIGSICNAVRFVLKNPICNQLNFRCRCTILIRHSRRRTGRQNPCTTQCFAWWCSWMWRTCSFWLSKRCWFLAWTTAKEWACRFFKHTLTQILDCIFHSAWIWVVGVSWPNGCCLSLLRPMAWFDSVWHRRPSVLLCCNHCKFLQLFLTVISFLGVVFVQRVVLLRRSSVPLLDYQQNTSKDCPRRSQTCGKLARTKV